MIPLHPFHLTEPTPSGSHTVTITRTGPSLWRVSWSVIRTGSVHGGSQTRRSEAEAFTLAERVVERLRRLTELEAA